MVLNWKKGGTPTSKEGLGQPLTDLAPDTHGTAYADWGIFCLDIDSKMTYKDGTRQYRAFLYTKAVSYTQIPLICVRGYLADAIKAVEDLMFSTEYSLPVETSKAVQTCAAAESEVRCIDGYIFLINTTCKTMMVEVPVRSYDVSMKKLAQHCAKLAVEDGYVITSVTEVFRMSKDTPRVPVLTSKAYKAEIKRLMELQKASYQKQLADCKSWELRLDHEAFTAYQPERQKAFENRAQKRQEAYALVKQNPELAADLIERLINQIHEEC